MSDFVARQAVAPAGECGGGLERGDIVRPTGAVLMFIHRDEPDDKTGPTFEASFEVMDNKDLDSMGSTHEDPCLRESGGGLVGSRRARERVCIFLCALTALYVCMGVFRSLHRPPSLTGISMRASAVGKL